MFIPISPNINWMVSTNWPRTRQIFKPYFHQVHLSATSSDVGNDPNFFNRHLVGGAGILTCSHWASKVSGSSTDTSGNGTYTITTIQGKGNKFISFIAAYIAVQKGSDIGVESLYAQQYTIYKRSCIRAGRTPDYSFCPRRDAIR